MFNRLNQVGSWGFAALGHDRRFLQGMWLSQTLLDSMQGVTRVIVCNVQVVMLDEVFLAYFWSVINRDLFQWPLNLSSANTNWGPNGRCPTSWNHLLYRKYTHCANKMSFFHCSFALGWGSSELCQAVKCVWKPLGEGCFNQWDLSW